jgi:hypothetical protein
MFAVIRQARVTAHCSAADLNPNLARGVPGHTIHARIEREQWYVAIYPAGVEMKGTVVLGSREEAELQGSRHDKRLAEKALQATTKIRLTPTRATQAAEKETAGRRATDAGWKRLER